MYQMPHHLNRITKVTFLFSYGGIKYNERLPTPTKQPVRLSFQNYSYYNFSLLRSSSSESLSIRFPNCKIVFQGGCLQVRLCSFEVTCLPVFLCSCLPVSWFSCDIVFLWGWLLVRYSSVCLSSCEIVRSSFSKDIFVQYGVWGGWCN